MKIRIGISTCPNDTYAFHALLNALIDTEGLQFTFELADVEELNRRLFDGDFDVAKASYHAAHLLGGQVVALRSGSALGYGVGPVLIGTRRSIDATAPRVLGPGERTTATLLYRIFYGDASIQQTLFSDIFPALERGEADHGICIHEGRFTYAERGLVLIDDLGARWEALTHHPLPLGGIVARATLSDDVLLRVDRCIRRSIEYANDHPDEALVSMRCHAQEFDDDVLRKHVTLYVNETTLDLGTIGVAALQELGRRGREAGVLPTGAALEVVG